MAAAPQHRPEGVVVALAEGGEVEVEQPLWGGRHGAVQPDVPGNGVGHIHTALADLSAVRVAAGAPDERHAYAGALCRGFEGAAEHGVEVARSERLDAPGTGLLQQQPCPRRGGGPRERLVEVSGRGCARTHRGEPNLTSARATSGRAEGVRRGRAGGVNGRPRVATCRGGPTGTEALAVVGRRREGPAL